MGPYGASDDKDERAQHGTWTVVAVVWASEPSVRFAECPGTETDPKVHLASFASRSLYTHVEPYDSFTVALAWFSSVSAGVASVQTLLTGLNAQSANISPSVGIATGETYLGSRTSASPARRARALAELAAPFQVLVATASYEVARDSLSQGFGFIEIGMVELQRIPRRERVFQLVHQTLRRTFPPLLVEDRIVNNLDTSFGFLVGRQHEREQVLRGLDTGRIVTILGPSGIGKSHLACRVASEVLETWAEGALWVDLNGVKTSDELENALARSIGIDDEPGGSSESFLSFVADQKFVVVLDGTDSCLPHLSRFFEAALRSPGSRFIVTAARRLAIPAEKVIRLGGLSVPPVGEALDADTLEDFDATALFMDIARATRPSFAASASPETVAHICRALGGVPLAIVLAGLRTRHHPLSKIVEQLGSITGPPTTSRPPSSDRRHRSLIAAVGWSCSALSSRAWDLLRAVTILRGSWTAVDAAAVADEDERQVEDPLRELLDAGLVVESGSHHGCTAYSLPKAVASYAAAWVDKEEVDGLRERHGFRFIGLLCAAVPYLSGSSQNEHLETLDWYRRDLAAAFDSTIQPGKHPGSFVEAIVLSWSYWYKRNRTAEAIKLIERAIRSAPDKKHTDISRLLNVAGILAMKEGEPRAARRYLKRALGNGIMRKHPALFASVHGNLAAVEWTEGDPVTALRSFEKAIAGWRSLSNWPMLGHTLVTAIPSFLEANRIAEARSAFEEARQLLSCSQDALVRWGLNLSRAQLDLADGDVQAARINLRLALQQARSMGDHASIARTLLWLAQAEASDGRAELAAQLLGAMRSAGSRAQAHLFPTNELRTARIEGSIRTAIGDAALKQQELVGELSTLAELLDYSLGT